MNCAINCYDSGITPADIYNINILISMWMADALWKEVNTTTIQSCWHKLDILPDTLLNSAPTPTAPALSLPISSPLNNDLIDAAVIEAEREVMLSLSYLEAIGVLQPHNRMDLNEILNLQNENIMYDNGTDQEIYDAVMAQCKAEGDMESNGGDDSDNVEARPLCQEALLAASTLWSFLSDIDEPFAHKLEAVLSSFSWQTHLDKFSSLKPSVISDYFAPCSS
ncbi:hypothetical protein H0H87_011461 [Tephrocybe sp. NHM501043]|nr:hypothetical protein H0H87_011461 [Tephrocybe sp. NHM501043]